MSTVDSWCPSQSHKSRNGIKTLGKPRSRENPGSKVRISCPEPLLALKARIHPILQRTSCNRGMISQQTLQGWAFLTTIISMQAETNLQIQLAIVDFWFYFFLFFIFHIWKLKILNKEPNSENISEAAFRISEELVRKILTWFKK